VIGTGEGERPEASAAEPPAAAEPGAEAAATELPAAPAAEPPAVETAEPAADADVGGSPFRISYDITVDGFVDASRLALTWMRTRVLVLAAVAAVAGLLLVVLAPDGPGLMLVFFAVILVAFIATPAPERWLVRRRAGDVIGTPVTILVTMEGLDVSTPTAGGQITWAGLTDVRDDGRAVVFLRQRAVAAWAPAAALGTPERRAEIVRFARGRIAATR
jgi:hypothetical protein